MKYSMKMVGTDAEVFLWDLYTNKQKPSVGIFKGTKTAPQPVEELGPGFFIQEDNVMPEFNVPPAADAKTFAENIGKMLGWVNKEAAKVRCRTVIKSSMFFTHIQLKSKQAQTFGCDPDFNAWTCTENVLDRNNPLLETLRTAAAHVHVSYDVDGASPETPEARYLAVRAHDLFLGVPSVLMEDDKFRRRIYGKAGSFRFTPYGHEYRTLGNSWIESPETCKWVFNQTQAALDFASSDAGYKALVEDKELGQIIQHAINNGDQASADWLCHKWNISI